MSRRLSPELLLVLAIPLAALLGGAATLRLAAGDLSVDGATEGVRRTAQVQTAELGPDLAAARRGLEAGLRVDRASGLVRIRVADAAIEGDELQLEFVHALQAERDLHVRLRRHGEEWIGAPTPAGDARWRVQLGDRARAWRLVGTLPRGASQAQLRPALAPP